MAEARPMFFYKDIQDAKSGNYNELAARLRKRARIFVIVSCAIIVLFSISAIHSFTIYLSTSLTSSLVNAILWIVLIIFQALLMLNYHSKLRRVAGWFSKQETATS